MSPPLNTQKQGTINFRALCMRLFTYLELIMYAISHCFIVITGCILRAVTAYFYARTLSKGNVSSGHRGLGLKSAFSSSWEHINRNRLIVVALASF